MDTIHALIEETTESFLSLSPPQWEGSADEPGSESSPGTKPAATTILDSSASRTMSDTFLLLLSHPVCGTAARTKTVPHLPRLVRPPAPPPPPHSVSCERD